MASTSTSATPIPGPNGSRPAAPPSVDVDLTVAGPPPAPPPDPLRRPATEPASAGPRATEPPGPAADPPAPPAAPLASGGSLTPGASGRPADSSLPDPAALDRLWQPQSLIPVPKAVPRTGWRKGVYKVSAGKVNPGPSSAEAMRDDLRHQVTKPLAARRGERIAVLSTKGGVGKTTTTLMLGHTLAIERGDRIVALDANPDYGTLGYRVSPDTQRTVRDLLDARQGIHSYPDVRAYTTQAPSRLEVLAGDADPAVSDAYTAQDYADSLGILGQHYNVILTDCGTGVLHDAMRAVLHMATQLVIVTGPAVDQARHADHLLRWLHKHGADHLVGSAVTVVNAARNDLAVDVDGLEAHFQQITRSVVRVPYDPVLAAGGIDGLDRLDRATQDAYLALAAAVTAGFGRDA
ncbi:AAA family ATPase [Iamia sp. SCSIO 61187]|uniref:MinD/ParA family ATP-binding protein n=1 Tax=Iamia sp. SCSIO 61187 TaxID=2722752 RepID=UPI001C630563|nr:AAA family ATPase [Iamia sp. SCSIO 61187]QYG91626.1 AAA family ATPase [Iamia sp. SCSIO 61187]